MKTIFLFLVGEECRRVIVGTNVFCGIEEELVVIGLKLQ